MTRQDNDDQTKGVILYDINTYGKWTNETNLTKDQNVYAKYQKTQINNYNYILKFGSWIRSKVIGSSQDNTLKFIFTSSKPWNQSKVAVSDSGYIAVLQENLIQVYQNLNELIWRAEVHTQFVRICNIFLYEKSDLLVYSDEFGNIYFFDLNDGIELFKYTENLSIEFENSICKVFFIDKEAANLTHLSEDITDLMLSVTYSGHFNLFALHADKSVSKLYSQSLTSIVPNGVYCAEIDSTNQYLILGSFVSNASSSSSKRTSVTNVGGLFLWRILNSEPWIKHVEVAAANSGTNKSSSASLSSSSVNFSKIEYVTKLEIATDNNTLAAIYVSGKIAVYSFPSLKLISEWFMTEQPCYNELNSEIIENPHELKAFKQIYAESDFRVVDIGWWNRAVLILTRGTGLLSLASSDDLSSLMGRNQQWLSPYPTIYRLRKNEFILLNCSCRLSSQASPPHLDDESLSCATDNHTPDDTTEHDSSGNNNNNNNSNEDEDDEDDDSWFAYAKQTVRAQAYNLIGLQRLRAAPKRAKLLRRHFSILHIKSTTPVELFERKLHLEEYGEALQLARSYGLDTDLVYQKQWRTKPISKSTICDYLHKIKKRSWILHECEERVSPNIDTTKYLIHFGLRGTDLDSLLAIARTDDNRFVYSPSESSGNGDNDDEKDVDDNDDDDDDSNERVDIFNPNYARKQRERRERLRAHKIAKLDTAHLTPAQRQLCATRAKLLGYLDRLTVYEQILGGALRAADLFDAERFVQIRARPVLDVAVEYAREGNASAVEILFAYYTRPLAPRLLDVLDNFAEILDPHEYARLLPRIHSLSARDTSASTSVAVYDDAQELRDNDDDRDWIERPEFAHIYAAADNVYADERQTSSNNSSSNSKYFLFDAEHIEAWYQRRTLQIEQHGRLVDVTLAFAELAVANGCRQMAPLLEDVRILYTLVYECHAVNHVDYRLEQVRALSRDIDKLELIMRHATDLADNAERPQPVLYERALHEWLLPFVARRPNTQAREALLCAYFTNVSRNELTACARLLDLRLKSLPLSSSAAPSASCPLAMLHEVNVVAIVVACLYECDKPDQMSLCAQIVNKMADAVKNASAESTTRSQHHQSHKVTLPQTSTKQHQQQQQAPTDTAASLSLSQAQQQQLREVQEHLRACELFRSYGVNITLAYIRESCASPDACRSALLKLTWFASKRDTHLRMSEWIELMKDLKSLQATLYRELVSYQKCSEIFLVSLLGSRNSDNIRLAGDWLRDIYSVDREAAVRLSVRAAQEYFNASANYLDQDMGFAKECLHLVQQLIVESHLNDKRQQHQQQQQQQQQQTSQPESMRATLSELAQRDPVVRKCADVIYYELDLIKSMKLIADFGYSILPVQVRASDNRFDIVRDIVRKNDNAYKDYERVLTLASHLHIRLDPNELHEVMLLIGEHALARRNLLVAQPMCARLVQLNHAAAWSCVHRLAYQLGLALAEQHSMLAAKELKALQLQLQQQQQPQHQQSFHANCSVVFKTIGAFKFNFNLIASALYSGREKTVQALVDLERWLAFALTHCAADRIEEILYQKRAVETARRRLDNEIDDNDDNDNDNDNSDEQNDYDEEQAWNDEARAEDASHAAASSVAETQSVARGSAGRCLQLEPSVLTYFHEPNVCDADAVRTLNVKLSRVLRRLLRIKRALAAASSQRNASKTKASAATADACAPLVRSLVRWLNVLARIDTNLAVAFLLELNDAEHLQWLDDSAFKLNSSASYEYVLYVFGLTLAASSLLDKSTTTVSTSDDNKHYLYSLRPSSVIALVRHALDNNDNDNERQQQQQQKQSALANNNAHALRLFRRVHLRFTAFHQTNELRGLNVGVDIERFGVDATYQHDTILGLSMERRTFALACSLAKFYAFDMWLVYATHVEYLLVESCSGSSSLSSSSSSDGMSVADVERALAPLLSVLRARPDEFAAVMSAKVLPLLCTTDLHKLLVYYGLLAAVDATNSATAAATVNVSRREKNESHVRTLKKLIACSFSQLDYRELLTRPLDVIERYLDESNVQLFAKLLPRLGSLMTSDPSLMETDQQQQQQKQQQQQQTKLFSPSKVHVIWCLKKFWQQIETMAPESEPTQQQREWTTERQNAVLDAFDTLTDSVKKLDPESDFLFFARELTLNSRSCTRLNVPVRRELLRKLLKVFKQQQKQQTSTGGGGGAVGSGGQNGNDEAGGGGGGKAEKLIKDEFTRIQAHLKKVESVEKLLLLKTTASNKSAASNRSGGNTESNAVTAAFYISRLDICLSGCLLLEAAQDKSDESSTSAAASVNTALAPLQDILVEMLFDGAYDIHLLHELMAVLELSQLSSIKALISAGLSKTSESLKQSATATAKPTLLQSPPQAHLSPLGKQSESALKSQSAASQADLSSAKAACLTKLQTLLGVISAHLNSNEVSSSSSSDVTQQQQQHASSKKGGNKQAQNSKNNTASTPPSSGQAKLISEEDVMDCMRSFCNDQQVDIGVRLLILEELKKTVHHIKDDDLMVLLVHKTNAILRHCGHFDERVRPIETERIATETDRLALIGELIELADAPEHCLALVNLLKAWPEFAEDTDAESNNDDQRRAHVKPRIRVLLKLIECGVDLRDIADELVAAKKLTVADLEVIRQQLEATDAWQHSSSSPIIATGYTAVEGEDSADDSLLLLLRRAFELKLAFLKLCFAFDDIALVKKNLNLNDMAMLSLIGASDLSSSCSQQDAASTPADGNKAAPHGFVQLLLDVFGADQALFDLMLCKKRYCDLVNTPLYLLFVTRAVRNEPKPTLYDIVKALKQSGLHVEAAKVLADIDNVASAFRTLSVSLVLIDRFNTASK